MADLKASRVVMAAIKELERERGVLLPADVLERAKDPDSPLHEFFEWDDSVAANLYRLDQARTLIRTVKLTVTVEEISFSIPAYVRDPDRSASEPGYRSVASIRTEEDSARAVVVGEMERVVNAMNRAKNLAVALGFPEEIAQINALARGFIARMKPSDDDPAGPQPGVN